MAESGITMTTHALLIAVVLYVILTYVMKISAPQAEDNSILFGALALVYMLVFGHSAPSCATMNKNIMLTQFVCK